MELKGSQTEQNLKDAFAGESQANRRYLYFASKADVEGYNDVAAVFRSTAEGETGHAHGHLEYLEAVGDPATGLPMGDTVKNLEASIAGETHEYTDMYPGMAKTARDEGFDEIADWFETLAKAERSHAIVSRKHSITSTPSRVYLSSGGTLVPLLVQTTLNRGNSTCAKVASMHPRHPIEWKTEAFWDRDSLNDELARVYDVCHGCRRCVSLCDSFPTLLTLSTSLKRSRSMGLH